METPALDEIIGEEQIYGISYDIPRGRRAARELAALKARLAELEKPAEVWTDDTTEAITNNSR